MCENTSVRYSQHPAAGAVALQAEGLPAVCSSITPLLPGQHSGAEPSSADTLPGADPLTFLVCLSLASATGSLTSLGQAPDLCSSDLGLPDKVWGAFIDNTNMVILASCHP